MQWKDLIDNRRIRWWMLIVLIIAVALVVQTTWPGLSLIPDFGVSMGTGIVLAVFFAALSCEYIDSSLGMGYGTTLMPLLLLVGFQPLQIVPAILLSEFITGISAGLFHHRDGNVDLLRDRKVQGTAILLSVLSIVGVLAAVILALHITTFLLTVIIGAIILSIGIVILITTRRQLKYRKSHIIAIGTIAAFNKGLSGGGYGPLVTGGQMVSGVSPKHAVAITSLTEGLTCFVGLIAYLVMGGTLYWALAIPLLLGALLSVPVATLTVSKIPETFIRGSVGIVTCLLGLLIFVKLFI